PDEYALDVPPTRQTFQCRGSRSARYHPTKSFSDATTPPAIPLPGERKPAPIGHGVFHAFGLVGPNHYRRSATHHGGTLERRGRLVRARRTSAPARPAASPQRDGNRRAARVAGPLSTPTGSLRDIRRRPRPRNQHGR